MDISPLQGLSYYRLSQTDFDGTIEHFDPKSIENTPGEQLTLYPIPADTYVQMNMNGISAYTISFRDALGRVHKVHPESSSESGLLIKTEGLPDGVYILQLSSPKKTLEETLYIIH
jgi:hypothetical protein